MGAWVFCGYRFIVNITGEFSHPDSSIPVSSILPRERCLGVSRAAAALWGRIVALLSK